MSKYVTIDGRNYYSPCSECKDRYCSSCVIHKYMVYSICDKVDELVDMVDGTNEFIFDWDYEDGDLYEKILYLIKEHLKEKNDD